MTAWLRPSCVGAVFFCGWAVGFAQPTPPDPQAMRDRVDALLAERWQAESAVPAQLATDAEFIRRAHLDLVGIIPKVGDVRAFLADDDPNKRLRLIDRLLDNPGRISHSAATWRRILLDAAGNQQLDYYPSLENWLHNKLTANAPYDEIVRELIVAEGNIRQTGPALFFAAVGNRPDDNGIHRVDSEGQVLWHYPVANADGLRAY
jgi:hypothetical protein